MMASRRHSKINKFSVKKAGPHFFESQLLFVFISLFIDHHAIVDYGFGRLRQRQAVR